MTFEDAIAVTCVACNTSMELTVLFETPSDEARCEALRFEMECLGWKYSVAGHDVCSWCRPVKGRSPDK